MANLTNRMVGRPGLHAARDGFEVVTGAVTDGRYTVDPERGPPRPGRLPHTFVFEIGIGDRSATLVLRDGVVSDAFIDLAGEPDRSDTEESRLDELTADLARRLLGHRPIRSTTFPDWA